MFPKTVVAEPQCRPCGEAAPGAQGPHPRRSRSAWKSPAGNQDTAPAPRNGAFLQALAGLPCPRPGLCRSKAVWPRLWGTHRCVSAELVLPQAQHRPQTQLSPTRAPWFGALKAPFLFGVVKFRRQDAARSQLFCPSPTRSPIQGRAYFRLPPLHLLVSISAQRLQIPSDV